MKMKESFGTNSKLRPNFSLEYNTVIGYSIDEGKFPIDWQRLH
jgi:hypothetical protein